jgi:hypothetical protein
MSFEKLAPIKGGHGGCLCCGYQHGILPMDAIIAVGFGYAAVTKNGAEVYNESEMCQDNWDNAWTCQTAEDLAKQDPDNDWRIHLVAPLSERHYQRQGEDHWVLYEKGEGFA